MQETEAYPQKNLPRPGDGGLRRGRGGGISAGERDGLGSGGSGFDGSGEGEGGCEVGGDGNGGLADGKGGPAENFDKRADKGVVTQSFKFMCKFPSANAHLFDMTLQA